MCTSSEETLGKNVPNMAQSIVSMCSRTWSQERRIGVLHRSLDPRLSVWDCVPECVIDAHLKDAFEYLPEQRDSILYCAIPGSAVVRSVRRIDGYRSSPLVLKSLRFCSEGEIDAYHFPQESDYTYNFSELEDGEDCTISRESTPLTTSITKFEDNVIHTTAEVDNSELEDEADRRKPQQWADYSESEDVGTCTSPQLSASDVDDAASSPEPQEPFTIFEFDEDFDDDQLDDEPLEANSPEPKQLSPDHQSHLEVDTDQQDNESLRADSPESRELFTIYECDEEFDDGQPDDELLKADSPEPRELYTIYECDEEFDDGQQDDEPLEANRPEPQQFSPDRQSNLEVDDDQQDDESLEANSPEPRELSTIYECDEELDDGQQDDQSLKLDSPEPRELSTIYECDEEFDDGQQDNEPLEADSPEPRRLFPLRHESPVPEYDEEEDDEPLQADSPESRELSTIYECDEEFDDGQEGGEPLEADSPDPQQLSPDYQSNLEVDNDQQRDGPVEADSPEPRELSTIYECDEEFDDGQRDDKPLEADSPEPRRLFSLRHESPVPEYDEEKGDGRLEADSPEPRRLFPFRHVSPFTEYDDGEKDDEPLEAESPEPRRLFPVHQFHSKIYDPPQPAPQMETFCPGLLRRFLTPEEIVKFDQFEDWFVRMSERKFVDTSSENPVSETPNPEPRSLVPFRHDSPVPEYDDDEKDGEPVEADSPEPRRLFPVHQFHPKMYDPPHPATQMETSFCPGPLRRFLTPEEMLKFDQFEDWFVSMSGRKFIDRDATSPENLCISEVPSRPEWLLNNGRPVLESDDEDFEVMEYIPVESLTV